MRLMASGRRDGAPRVWKWALLVALCAFSGVTQAQANVFAVEGVQVDATADNAADAREIAHSQGRREAFTTVLRRLTRPQDWPRLPILGDQAITEMGAGLRIEDERNSRNRYLARITYNFRAESVRQVLLDANIPFSETQSPPILVLPVLEADGQLMLWEQSNPWFEAWSAQSLGNELVPVIAPLGDLTDISAIDADTALRGDWLYMETMVQRYGASAVLLAHAVQGASDVSFSNDPLGQGGTPGSSYGAGTASRPADVGVPPTGAVPAESGDVRLQLSLVRIERADRRPFSTVVQGPLVRPQSATTETVYDLAVREALSVISDDWKSQTLVDYGTRYLMEATVRLASVQDWTDIRGRLADIPTIVTTETLALSARGAELRIVFAGAIEQLALNLNQRGLMLSGENGYWEITRRGIVPAALEDTYGNRPPVYPLNQGVPTADGGLGQPYPPQGTPAGFNGPGAPEQGVPGQTYQDNASYPAEPQPAYPNGNQGGQPAYNPRGDDGAYQNR